MSFDSLTYRKLLIGAAVWSSLWTALQAMVLFRLGFNLETALVDSAVTNGLLAVICFALHTMLRFYQPGKNKYLTLFIWSLGASALWLWLSNKLLEYLLSGNLYYQSFLGQSLPIRYCVALLFIGWMILLSWIFNITLAGKESEKRKSEMEKLAKEAELVSLRQQLQPHFLFNSLNSINALIGSRPEEARKMIQQLSDFLRGTLKKDDKQLVSLDEEIKHLKLYLEIEKVRFGHRLNVIIEIEGSTLIMKLPSLLLQPIVENAIKFGLYDTIGETSIKIKTSRVDQNLVLSVENPFDPETAQPRQGAGFGLDSIKRKLYLLYGRNDLLQTSGIDKIFTTTIIVPQSL